MKRSLCIITIHVRSASLTSLPQQRNYPVITFFTRSPRPAKFPYLFIDIFFTSSACLRSWLERNHSCPTCRKPLRSEDGTDQQNHPRANHVSDNTVPQPLFRFNPLLRWMPPLRVQVTHWPRQRVRQASTTAPEEWVYLFLLYDASSLSRRSP